MIRTDKRRCRGRVYQFAPHMLRASLIRAHPYTMATVLAFIAGFLAMRA